MNIEERILEDMAHPPINDLDLIYRTVLENRALLEAVLRHLNKLETESGLEAVLRHLNKLETESDDAPTFVSYLDKPSD